MASPDEGKKLEFRVALLERAYTAASTQIAELTSALAALVRRQETGIEEPPPAPILIDPDSVTPYSMGFYRREEDSAGRQFRWTGRGEHFEFRLGLNRNVPWSFAAEFRPNAHVKPQFLRAFADYVEVATEIDPSGRLVQGVIPVREFGRSAVLTFLLPNTFRPTDIDPASKDARTLGLAFYGLKLEPVAAAEIAQRVNGLEMPMGGPEAEQGRA